MSGDPATGEVEFRMTAEGEDVAPETGDGSVAVVWDDSYPALADHYRRAFA